MKDTGHIYDLKNS